MEKTFNMTIEELKQKLYEMINNSGLPFSSVYYLFKDFMRELTDAYTDILNNEFKQYEEQKKQEEIETKEGDIDEEDE